MGTRIAQCEDALLQGEPTVQHSPNDRTAHDAGPLDEVLSSIVELTYADARELAEPNRMAALEL